MIEDLIDKAVDKDIGRDVSLTQIHIAAFFVVQKLSKSPPGSSV
jgi:hypothetical protein